MSSSRTRAHQPACPDEVLFCPAEQIEESRLQRRQRHLPPTMWRLPRRASRQYRLQGYQERGTSYMSDEMSAPASLTQ